MRSDLKPIPIIVKTKTDGENVIDDIEAVRLLSPAQYDIYLFSSSKTILCSFEKWIFGNDWVVLSIFSQKAIRRLDAFYLMPDYTVQRDL
jgi:hypothetical protein